MTNAEEVWIRAIEVFMKSPISHEDFGVHTKEEAVEFANYVTDKYVDRFE
jgi:hypothetical protein